jgi:uncharacterized protein (TIGR00269 family)
LTTCNRCNGKVVYARRYSGEMLCASCFKESIVEKVRKAISKYDMIRYGQRVGVALSGGKDSLSLLSILHTLNKNKNCELIALTVDEGVKGYREESIEHAIDMTKRLGIKHVIVSYKELYGFNLDEALEWKDQRDVSSCSICGVFRRRAIDEAALRSEVGVIATAHNLDDYAQTFLMNLFNGDIDRIAWLDPLEVYNDFPLRRIKPFIEVYEEEIALYAYLSDIQFQSVSCPYMHEGLRSEVRDFLNEMEAKHPGIKNVLLRSSLQTASKLSSSMQKSLILPCSICGKPSSKGICNVCKLKTLIQQQTKYNT